MGNSLADSGAENTNGTGKFLHALFFFRIGGVGVRLCKKGKPMPSKFTLMKRRDRLVRQIGDNLDYLIGSVSTKGLKVEAYNLTTKVDGVTKSKHIPKDMVKLVRRMTKRHQRLKALIKELGEVNWLLIREGIDLRDYGTA